MEHPMTRHRHELKRRHLTVKETASIGPNMIRIVFEGDDLADFVSLGADDHVKLFIPAMSGELEPVPKGLSDWGTRDSKGLFRPSWSERCGPQPLAGSIVARDFDMKRI